MLFVASKRDFVRIVSSGIGARVAHSRTSRRSMRLAGGESLNAYRGLTDGCAARGHRHRFPPPFWRFRKRLLVDVVFQRMVRKSRDEFR